MSIKRLKLCLSAIALLAGAALTAAGARPASADEHRRHVVEVHRGYPRGYVRVIVPRERFYRGIPIYRHYGPVFGGYAYFYDDVAAFPFLGFTAWELALQARLDEEQMRAHEQAFVEATSAPVNDAITWNDGPASGSVTTTREGHTPDGRECREFQQEINIGGNTEKGFGTACRQPDGSWQIVKQ